MSKCQLGVDVPLFWSYKMTGLSTWWRLFENRWRLRSIRIWSMESDNNLTIFSVLWHLSWYLYFAQNRLSYSVSQQVLDEKFFMKISNMRKIWIFVKNIRQIEVRSALLSKNVNKLTRVFSLFVTFSDFLLNSCLKIVRIPCTILKQDWKCLSGLRPRKFSGTWYFM